MVGFAEVELNPPGPAQLYVPPPVAVKVTFPPSQTGPELVAVATQALHGAGAVYGFVSVHVGSAEKVAVTVQAAPLAFKFGNV
jgi:hypothetical protein